ncbi:isoprenoid synthase domain-containing protein [Mycena olivaceomarginata]|nr:isoprenoid synthase domain-containing protein [Mycena olivaceomarginata]
MASRTFPKWMTTNVGSPATYRKKPASLSYDVRQFVCIPPARNHDELTAVTDSFFLDAWPFESQDQRDLFVKCGYATWVTKTIPDGEFERMIWACRVFALLSLTDDWIDQQVAVAIRPGVDHESGENRFSARSKQPPEWNSIASLAAWRANASVQASGHAAHKSILEYLDFRRYNSGGYFALALARYALDIYLTDEELQTHCSRNASVLPWNTSDAIAMEKDVASYEKGLQHKTLGSNLVPYCWEHGTDGFTSTSASVGKEYVRYRTSDSEAELQNSISGGAGTRRLGTSDTIRRWLQAVPYITRRYNIPGRLFRAELYISRAISSSRNPSKVSESSTRA